MATPVYFKVGHHGVEVGYGLAGLAHSAHGNPSEFVAVECGE